MKAWIGGWSIATKLFVLQLVMIVVLAALAVAWIWADARADVERDAAAKSLAVAETLAADPYVATALGTPDPTARLQPYAVAVMDEAGIDFITIMAPDRIRYTHPDPTQIGQEFLGNIDRALAGDAFTETYTGTLGPSVRAVVPVFGDDGEVVALVAAGVTVSNTQVGARRPHRHGHPRGARDDRHRRGHRVAAQPLPAPGHLGPRRRGDEPHVLVLRGRAALHRRGARAAGPLERRGALQRPGRRAARPARRPARPPPRPCRSRELDLPPAVADVLARTDAAVDEIAITPTHVLVIDRDVIVSRERSRGGGRIGTVTTLRDHTELQELTGELETMTTLSDALRSQAHEFANRLHTIIALIELDRPADAAALASSELALSQALADRLLSAVEEPVLLALLLGKAAQASERGIAFEIDLPDRLEPTSVPAARPHHDRRQPHRQRARRRRRARRRPRVHVAVEATDAALRIAVGDSGAGPRDGDRVFDLGVTTKEATGHGIGLALVRQTVTRLGGEHPGAGLDVRGDPAARRCDARHGGSGTAATATRRPATRARAPRMPEALRVLVVEDEPVTAEAHAAYVGRVDGFEVAGIAHAGHEAIRMLRDAREGRIAPIDLILLDVNLPDTTGIELCRSLRAAGIEIDVIAVTAVRDAAVVRSAVSLGIVQYLIKPFGFAAFAEKLNAYRDYHARVGTAAPELGWR